MEAILAKVEAPASVLINCWLDEDSNVTFIKDLLHIAEQEGSCFKPIQKLLSHRTNSSHQRAFATRTKIVYRQQEQLAKMALWGCIDRLLKEAWESHDDFYNPLCNLFRRVSSLITINQGQSLCATEYLYDWPTDCMANFRPRIPRVDPTSQAIIDVCRNLMSQWLCLDSEATYKSAQVVQFFVDRLGAEATLLDLRKFDVSTPTKMADLQAKLENAIIINQDSIGRTMLRQIASVSGAPDQAELTSILVCIYPFSCARTLTYLNVSV